jgi:beta-lactamase regulating signal transducer with metallopeptidase domain
MGMGAELGWFITMLEVSFSELRGFTSGLGLSGLDLSALLTHLSQASAGILLTAIWQGLAIAACLTLCLRVVPRLSAASRFAILAAGFLAVAALPFLPALGSMAVRRGVVGISAAAATPWLTLDTRWSLAVAGLWACASLWRLGDLSVHSLRLRRLWKSARPVDASLSVLSASALPAVFPSLRGRKPVEICTTDALERPSVIGFLAPRILIPGWLLERMTPAELDQIVLHETEHLRRGDDWTNLLQKLALVFFPLNPALVWLERRLCLEREMACDEGVIRRTREPRAYAACLTRLAEHGLERRVQALSLGAWHRRAELVRRVHRILRHKPELKPAAARGLVAVLGCGLLAGSAELARCPQVIGFVSVPPASSQAKDRKMADALTASNASSSADFAGDRVLRPEMQTVAAQATQGMRPHMTELRATLPVRENERPTASNSLAMLRQTRQTPQETKLAASAPHEELLKAEEPDAKQTAKSSPAGLSLAGNEDGSDVAQDSDTHGWGTQGWIVLTTWEQTDIPGEATQQAAQSDTASEDRTRDALANSAKPAHLARQVTVTRLVFRVTQTPAQGEHGDAPPPPQPTIVPVRGGWLIFRL